MALVHQTLIMLVGAIAYFIVRWPPNTASIITETLDDSYDYIVVGGGTAGSVVAARLSEDTDNKVLLLEAGGHYTQSRKFHRPGEFLHMFHSKYDWAYHTEPQRESGFGLNERKQYWPRGRVLGGSGMLNLMQYVRGSPHDFNEWSSNGCDGWSYTDVLPYFLKSEDIAIDELKLSKYHSTGGPIAVSSGTVTPLANLYAQAVEELGFKLKDYNGEDQDSFDFVQLNTRNGIRSSAAFEFLSRTAEKNNIHIAVDSLVVRIEIQNKRALGVHVIKDGIKQFINASKEVIVCAGSINSPQLLMLSGIGPKEHLAEFNIPLTADLPVGTNLADHVQLMIPNKINMSYSITSMLRESWSTQLKYIILGTGPLSVSGSEFTGFVYLDESKRGKSYPEIQVIIGSTLVDRNSNLFNFNEDAIKDYLAESSNVNGFTFSVMLTHPRSKGTIKLQSTDPFDYPAIDVQHLSDTEDINDFIRGIRIWEKFVQTQTVKQLGVNIEQMKLAVCAQHEFRSDAYWECIVRHFITTVYHHCGTCRMGADGDPSAVVDPKLRVKGIHGLRVVDASVFPNVISGNIHAAVVMVAEKAADIIRGIDSASEYRKRFS